MSTRTKVYELAKELGIEASAMLSSIQRLGIDSKTSTSFLGTEEVKTIREHYRKNRPVSKGAAQAASQGKNPMTEKRVGTTVIRRRSKGTEAVAEAGGAAFLPLIIEPVVESEETEESLPETESRIEASESGTPEAEEVALASYEASETPVTETPPTRATGATVAAPSVMAKDPRRRMVSSIIKKVATEQHLSEKVGPKVARAPKKEVTPTGKPADTQPKPGTAGTVAGSAVGGPKRVREIDLAGLAGGEAAKEAGRRKLLERQNIVFKSSDYLKRELVHSTRKKKAAMTRPLQKTQITTPAEHKRVVEMGNQISVSELAKALGAKAAAVITKLMAMGVTATINQSIDFDTASLLAQEFKYEVKQTTFKEEEFLSVGDSPEGEKVPRAPVVTIMGHVDHGKTSLLDYIRKAKVAAGEAGGITQHIGAYTVQLPKGKISFIDTPGHEAFTAMRARGARVTDIVVLVVSAVDGVMPQTLESISHAKAGKVPIIVAVNKIDLPEANADRIKQTLAGYELTPEEWGGDTIYVNVSAKTGQGVDKLLESILLQAELLELKASLGCSARGIIVESKLDKNRGPVATMLVQHGQLKGGDLLVCGTTFGKVRALHNSFGQKVNEAMPSEPVEILGLQAVPNAGDEAIVVADEELARKITSERADRAREKSGESKKMTLEEMLAAPATEKELLVILKADVQGSAEALKEALLKFPSDKVKLKVLHSGSGGITESDVMLAQASRALIVGFNVRPDIKALKLAEQEKVSIRTYSIIYELLDDIKKNLEGLLDVRIKEKVIGRAEVRDVFQIPKIGTVAGSAVLDGKVIRGCFLRLLRDSKVIYEGKLSSLRRFKEDVKEVTSGFECGIGLENFSDVKLGDQFEAFVKEEFQGVL